MTIRYLYGTVRRCGFRFDRAETYSARVIKRLKRVDYFIAHVRRVMRIKWELMAGKISLDDSSREANRGFFTSFCGVSQIVELSLNFVPESCMEIIAAADTS